MKPCLILFFTIIFLFACGNKQQQKTAHVDAHVAWAYSAVIYEVNIRQFSPEGTFRAFARQLPRLKSLGVDILWFMPIQAIGEKDRKGSLGSYYSIKDYTQVNPEFGTLEDFKEVVAKAHDVGMKVILDWVANHTSRDAKWIDAHPEWYTKDSLGNIVAPYDWTDVADLNYDNADMRTAMIQDMLFWIREVDIDGFRCDVAGEVPVDFWETAVDSIKAVKSDIFMLAEAEKPELNSKAFDAFYAWDFHHKMNMVAQGKEPVDSLRASLKRIQNRFPKTAIPMFFTSNHDENSWNGTEFERMGDAAKSLAALSYILPGMPLIYNGQEVGFDKRLAFFEKDSIDWTDTAEFTAFYQHLNRLKASENVLFAPEKGGSFIEIGNDKSDKVWSFIRLKEGNAIACVFNLSNQPLLVTLDESISGKSVADNSVIEKQKRVELKAWGYWVCLK